MSPGRLGRVELACRDPRRQQEFYSKVLDMRPSYQGSAPRFLLGEVELVLRPRGDALFPQGGGGGTLLAFEVAAEELDRWHRRMLTARVPVLDAPGPGGGPPRHLRLADPEGNVVELFVAS